ncbi:MAG TPA: hypothetical protein VGN83_09225 [Falsiroseomonas sp.]|jgi:hypothetical protein|nr:hypothetical protein [Falsiroseomonas sp.]
MGWPGGAGERQGLHARHPVGEARAGELTLDQAGVAGGDAAGEGDQREEGQVGGGEGAGEEFAVDQRLPEGELGAQAGLGGGDGLGVALVGRGEEDGFDQVFEVGGDVLVGFADHAALDGAAGLLQ